jgi:SAM-dependent methyltransferase
MASDWDRSAGAWLAAMSEGGDWARRAVLDRAMLDRVSQLAPADALDVGCGEGRFCRLLSDMGIKSVGVDPTLAFIEAARQLDPAGFYDVGTVESLPYRDGAFDLVVSYMSLVDIEDVGRAISEMARVLAPGGALLIANLASHNSAGHWLTDQEGRAIGYLVDRYLEERPIRQQWAGIDIVNWHRPLSAYVQTLLDNRLRLTFFDEPAPAPDQDVTKGKYARAPWFVVMEWRKDHPVRDD